MRAGDRAGFTYVWMLAALALLSLGLAQIGPSWSDQVRRDKEQDLVRIGTLYAHAIGRYRQGSPGAEKEFPKQLEDLLLDTRMVGTVRYLRKLYLDPLDPGGTWGLVLDARGRIQGVFSRSTSAPLRTETMNVPGLAKLGAASRYADWKFVAEVAP